MAETNPSSAPHSIEQPNEPFVRMNVTREEELHRESHNSLYLKVWAWLLAFTIAEYLYARFSKEYFLFLVLGLLTMALIKAAMVGWYFMHLKFEGKWVYAMLIPAGILAIILTVALCPDVAMQPVTEENPSQEEEPSVMREPLVVPLVARS